MATLLLGSKTSRDSGSTTFRIYRYNPDTDGLPHFDRFEFEPYKAMTVLDGLFFILENFDPTLAFRCSCRAAVCGSCAMHINGKYRLACMTQIESLKSPQIVVRPLWHLKVIRDLVVDMEHFFDNYKLISPWVIPKAEPPETEYPQSPQERKRLDVVTDCIMCGCCYGACPPALTDNRYLGPHTLLKALRFVTDSRDGAKATRLQQIGSDFGVFRCHTVFNCQNVCPKDLDPAGAIAKLKMQIVWNKLTGR